MTQEQKVGLENYEKMHTSVTEGLEDAKKRLAQLNCQGKQKSATYKQLMLQKTTYKNVLDLYRLFDLEKSVFLFVL